MGHMPSLYVHVPFCVVKCPYCDFYSVVEKGEPIDDFLSALDHELERRARGVKPATVFVGGGTPSHLSLPETGRLIQLLLAHVDLSAVAEFTVEANPESLSEAKIRLWRDAGATRFSMGVQSFDAGKLVFLGRAHDAGAARSAFRALRAVGGDVNIDLMFAVPGETPETWSRDLDEAIALGPDHLSAYGLTIEPGTEFGRRKRRGELGECDEETWCRLFELTRERLSIAGLDPYEISNFARPGHECRHNLNYWRNGEYIGVGPSAASFTGGVRRRNIADVRKYVDALARASDATAFEERLVPERQVGESLMLGLRLEQGVSVSEHRALYGVDLLESHSSEIDRLRSEGLLALEGDRLRLTSSGRRVADSVIEAFLP